MVEIVIAVATAFIAAFTAFLGWRVSTNTPTTTAAKRRYEWAFILCGLLACLLVGIQAYLSNASQNDLRAKLEKIEKNTNEPPHVSVNVPPAQIVLTPQSVPITRDTAKRPWIFVTGVSMDKSSREVRLAFSNQGATPAYGVVYRRWLEMGSMRPSLENGKLGLRRLFVKQLDSRTTTEGKIGLGFVAESDIGTMPQGQGFVDAWVDDSEKWAAELGLNNNQVVLSVGGITYSDQHSKAGGQYATSFCYQTQKDNLTGEWFIIKCSHSTTNDSR